MTVCVDTNVLIQARSKRHRYGVILDGFMFGLMDWAMSNRVVTEYREIIHGKAGMAAWSTLEAFIDLIDRSGNVRWISPHYQFRIIGSDPDDNAFTDCAIAAHADYVITEDRDFAPLTNAGYKPQPITPDEFIAKYQGIYV